MDEPDDASGAVLDASGAVLDAVRVIGRRATPELVRAHLPGLTLADVEARMEQLVKSGHLRHSGAFARPDLLGVDRIHWESYDLVE